MCADDEIVRARHRAWLRLLRDSIPLGTLELSSAYGTLAAGGVKYGKPQRPWPP